MAQQLGEQPTTSPPATAADCSTQVAPLSSHTAAVKGPAAESLSAAAAPPLLYMSTARQSGSVPRRAAAVATSATVAPDGTLGAAGAHAQRSLVDALAAAAAARLPGAQDSGAVSSGHAGASGLLQSLRPHGARPWMPSGVLCAHLAEHRRRVNALVASPPGGVSCVPWALSVSDDGTAKVWDVRALRGEPAGIADHDASAVAFRAAVTYASQGGRLTTAAALSTDAVATGSAAGSVHAWRLERGISRAAGAAAYVGASDVRRAPGSPACGAVTALAVAPSAARGALLFVATARGGVSAWDMRSPADALRLPWQRHAAADGAPTALVPDPAGGAWLAVATRRGALLLWDVRFCVPLAAWRHPSRLPVDALAAAHGAQLVSATTAAATSCGPLLWAAVGLGEVVLLDACHGSVAAVLRLRPSLGAPPPASTASPPLEAPAALLDLNGGDARDQQADAGDALRVRALLPTSPAALIAGYGDGALRNWTHTGVATAAAAGTAACALMAAPLHADAHDGAPYAAAWRGVPILEQRLRRLSALEPAAGPAPARAPVADAHADAVTALAAAPAPDGVGFPLLLSASRDGIIKAWR